ncbi:MAG: hypothetical protein U5K31_07940 [Balneolaceae bacterium]|nr:hypothetical protein [Balneolaceae bacterium]
MKRLLPYSLIITLACMIAVGCTSQQSDDEAMESDTTETTATLGGGADGEVPVDWQYRLDNPATEAVVGADTSTADIFWVNMVPGMHITSGPAAIYWDSTNTLSGDFRISSTMHLFDPGDRREAYGLFFGGRNLNADDQAYTYFLLRNGGQYLIKQRMGSETSIVENWTDTDAMVSYTDTTEASVPNTLAVERSGDTLNFFVNGTQVHTMPAGDMVTEGIAGLRVNHALNLHVENFEIE